MSHTKHLILAAVLLCFGNIAKAAPTAERYVLRHQNIKLSPGPSPTKNIDIWLWDSKTRRILWKQHIDQFYGLDEVYWSKDHRALIMPCFNRNRAHLFFWREGSTLHDLTLSQNQNPALEFTWSPDGRRVLYQIREGQYPSHLEAMLYCLRIDSGTHYKISKIAVAHETDWQDARTVRYWGVDVHYGGDTRPHYWHAP